MAWFRKKMWLSVDGGWEGWIDTPNSGADASTTGWGTESTFLNGGGYADHSWGTHKRYTFEWSDASTRQAAQFMQSLRNGSYGKGLIHFIEPTLYDTNILPARVAAPHLTAEDGGRPLVRGVNATAIPATIRPTLDTPYLSAQWTIPSSSVGFSRDYSTYIPIPEGYMLALGAVYASTGGGGVFVRYGGQDIRLPSLASSTQNVVSFSNELFLSDLRDARLWIGSLDAPGTVTVAAITARLIPRNRIFKTPLPGFGYGEQPYGLGPYGGSEFTAAWTNLTRGPWVGGMGNSGVKFNGTPTMVHNTGVNGGQVGFAASFIETGAWN